MGQKIATLEIELGMTTGGAVADLNRFGGVVDKVSAQAIRDLDRIDAATKGVGDLSAAEASMVRLAETSARSAISTARDMNRIERAGESMVAQLDRQIATYGKTASEIRSLKAEEAALAADRANKSELATRIREREAQLYDLEYAAMRRASQEADALAEDKAAAAAAADMNAAAMRAEAAAADKLATEHGQLAAQVRASHDAQQADAVAAERLRAATDPLYAATKRLNDEIAESTRLYHVGATAPAEYARQQEVLAGRLRNVEAGYDAATRGSARLGGALTQLSFQANDVITMWALGAPVGQIFFSQIGQIVQVVQTAEGGFMGLARAVGAALLPFAPLIIAAGLVAGGLAMLNKEMNEDSGLKAYAAGLGLTEKEMKKLGDVSVTAGDMLKGLWSVLSDDTAFGDFLSGAWSAIKAFTQNFWEVVIGMTGSFYTMFVGSYRGIVATWDKFPAAFADIFVQAVNGAIEKLNGLGQATNKLLGVELFGQIEPMKNAYAGAAEDVGSAWAKAFRDTKKEYDDGVSGFGDAWTKASIKAAEARLKLKSDDIKSDRTGSANGRADQLAREAAAMEAQIKNLYALADAYGVSGAAALIAEARVKAESQAIKARGDIEAFVDRQVRLAIAQRVSDAAKATAAMREQAKAQEQVNAQVAAGLIPSSAAAQLVRDQLADLPLLQAIEAARIQGSAADAATATKALEAQRAARDRLSEAEQAARFAATAAANDNELELLALETRLIGANAVERLRQIAALKAWQEAVAGNMKIDQALEYVAAQVAIAEAQDKLATGQERFNSLLTDSEDAVKRYASALGESFGSVGQSIAAMTAALVDHGAEQRRIEDERKNSIARAGTDAATLAKVERDYARASANSQINAYADITGAAKGMFSERSKIYKALETAETVFRAVQLAMSIQTMVQNAVETAATVANAGIRATAEGTAGVASQSKLPFPFNIAAMAATAAALVGFGVALLGGGGGGSAPTYNEGKGTVFGDSSAQSDSIKRSIDVLADLDTEMLAVSRQMASSLKAIENNIGGLSNLIIRLGGDEGIGSNASAGVNTGFNSSLPGYITSGTGFGVALGGIIAGPIGAAIGAALTKVPIIGDLLGGIGSLIGSLFGSKKTIVGQGIYGGSQTLGDIDSMGFDGQTFADVKKTKKFLGLSTGSSYSTQYGELDAALEDQFGKLLLSFADTIKLAAGPLGLSLTDVEAKLNSFVVDIGKIDLKDLTGEEIQEKLTAVFGAQADKMAQFVLGGLETFQQVGEGYFETLVRVATTVEAVTTSLDMLGLSTQSLGINASMAIAGFFDNAAAYQDAAGRYFEAFYTEAEQAAAKSAQLGKVFNSLGITMPDSIASFRDLVEAQDLATAGGQQMYATLLQLAPAFAEIVSAGQSASSAAAILRERQDLEKQVLEMQGDTAALRAMELAQIDPSNRALQQRIYALRDEATAAQEAAAIAQERAGLERSILQLQGDTAAIRQLELATLDPSNRALQERIYSLQDEAAAAQAAAKVASERAGLERQWLQLTGDTAALRALELAQLDPSNRALQAQIWLLTDQQKAADEAATAAKQLADAWRGVGDSIMDEIKRIRAIDDAGSAASLSGLQAKFATATAAARRGDMDAAQSLPELSRALLDVAAGSATSSVDLARIQGVTAASLEATYKVTQQAAKAQDAAVIAAERGNELAVEQQNWWKSFADQQAAQADNQEAANDALIVEVQGLREQIAAMAEDQRTGHAAIVSTGNRSAKVLENTSRGGDSFAVDVEGTVSTKEAA